MMSFRGFMNAGPFGGLSPTRGMAEPRRTSDPSTKSLELTDALDRVEPTTPPATRGDSFEMEDLQQAQEDSPPPLSKVKRPSDFTLEPPTAPSSARPSNGSFTRSFAGVARSSLPSLMTDEVDVDLRLTYTPVRARFTFRPPFNSTASSPSQHWDMTSEVSPSRRESRSAPPPITVEDLDLNLSDVLGMGPGAPSVGPSSVRSSPTTPRMPTTSTPTVSSPLRPAVSLRPPEHRQVGSAAPPFIRSLTSPRVARFPSLSPVIDNDGTMPEAPHSMMPPGIRYGGSSQAIMLRPVPDSAGSSPADSAPATPMSYDPPRSAVAQRFSHLARESRRPISMPIAPAAFLRPSLAERRAGSDESVSASLGAPTAPLPGRLMARRKQRASRLAQHESPRAEQDQEAMRKLAELEIQL